MKNALNTHSFKRAVFCARMPLLALALAVTVSACDKKDDSTAADVAKDAAPVASVSNAAAATEQHFVCGDKEVFFIVSPETADKGDLRLGSTRYAMERAISASGAKYENLGDPSTFFWNKGNTAHVSIDGVEFEECELQAAPKPVEEPAKTEEPSAAAKSAQPAVPAEPSTLDAALQTKEWHLKTINGEKLKDKQEVTLRFIQGRFAGRAACNMYNSSYKLKDSALTISPNIVSTMMACSDDLMKLEHSYLQALPKAKNAKLNKDGSLTLTGDGVNLVFNGR